MIASATQTHFEEGASIAFRELRINDQIRIPSLRLFDDTTDEAIGIVTLAEAQAMAQ